MVNPIFHFTLHPVRSSVEESKSDGGKRGTTPIYCSLIQKMAVTFSKGSLIDSLFNRPSMSPVSCLKVVMDTVERAVLCCNDILNHIH